MNKTELEVRIPFTARPRQGVPLSTTFFLLAVCGVFANIASLSWKAESDFYSYQSQRTLEVIVAGFILFGIVGLIVGAFQNRPRSGMLIVAPTCAILGAVLAPTILLPDAQAENLLQSIIVGSLVLVAVAALLQWLCRRTDLQQPIEDRATDQNSNMAQAIVSPPLKSLND